MCTITAWTVYVYYYSLDNLCVLLQPLQRLCNYCSLYDVYVILQSAQYMVFIYNMDIVCVLLQYG